MTTCDSIQLWGGDTIPFPILGYGLFRPILQQVRWPWPHNAVHLQNKRSAEAGDYADYASGNGYKTYLLNPPAPAYSFRSLLPVNAYEGILRQAWWQSEFRKFGLQGLRLTGARDLQPGQARGTPPAAVLLHGSYASTSADLWMAAYPSERNAVVLFMQTAEWALLGYGHAILAKYLNGLAEETIMPDVENRRLRYESRTWARTYDTEICGLSDSILRDFQNMDMVLGDFASTLPVDRPHLKLENVNEWLDVVLQSGLMELHRK